MASNNSAFGAREQYDKRVDSESTRVIFSGSILPWWAALVRLVVHMPSTDAALLQFIQVYATRCAVPSVSRHSGVTIVELGSKRTGRARLTPPIR